MDNFKKHLTEGEEVIWFKKASYKLFNLYDLLTIPITVFFFGSVSLIFSLYLYIQFKTNPALLMFYFTAGLLVYILSFYFIIGRFLYRKKRRQRETYILTNKRAVVFTELIEERIEEINLKEAYITHSKTDVRFTNEFSASEIFYNLGLDALIKARPKRCIAFRGLDDTASLLALINADKKAGDNS